jgi:hypothetical protein
VLRNVLSTNDPLPEGGVGVVLPTTIQFASGTTCQVQVAVDAVTDTAHVDVGAPE